MYPYVPYYILLGVSCLLISQLNSLKDLRQYLNLQFKHIIQCIKVNGCCWFIIVLHIFSTYLVQSVLLRRRAAGVSET